MIMMDSTTAPPPAPNTNHHSGSLPVSQNSPNSGSTSEPEESDQPNLSNQADDSPTSGENTTSNTANDLAAKLAKFLQCFQTDSPDSSMSQQQILAAAAMAATVAVNQDSSSSSMSPQEMLNQMMSMMMVAQQQQQQQLNNSNNSPNYETSAHAHEVTETSKSKRRKQSKPVRYEVLSGSGHTTANMSNNNNHTSMKESNLLDKFSTVVSASREEEEENSDQDDEDEEEEEEEEVVDEVRDYANSHKASGVNNAPTGGPAQMVASVRSVHTVPSPSSSSTFPSLPFNLSSSSPSLPSSSLSLQSSVASLINTVCPVPQCQAGPFANEATFRAHLDLEHHLPPHHPLHLHIMSRAAAALSSAAAGTPRKRKRSPSGQSVSSATNSDEEENSFSSVELKAESQRQPVSPKDVNHNLLGGLSLPPGLNFNTATLISNLTKQRLAESESHLPKSSAASSLSGNGNPTDLAFSNAMAPFLFPAMLGQHPSQFHQATSGGFSGPPPPSAMPGGLRIFNPEAYCELCNKEFCNKYFLKTHKANKHGIFDSNNGPTTSNSNSNMISSSNNSQSQAAMMTNLTNQSVGRASPSGSTNQPNSPKRATPDSVQASQGPQMIPLPQSTPPMLTSSPGGPGSQMNPASPYAAMRGLPPLNLNMINLDSYCEICQKEFCNKYFLKKHKQKIHGLVPGQPLGPLTPSSMSQETQLQQLQQLQMLHQQLAQQAQQQQQQQQQRAQSPEEALRQDKPSPPSPSQSGHSGSVGASAATGSNSNPLVNLDKSMNASASSSSQQSGEKAQSPLSVSTASGSMMVQPEMANFAAAGGQNSQLMLSAEKLRSMGVINADAFCEICCKEFCNKYFLRTHKINKHGIVEGGQPRTEKEREILVKQQRERELREMFPGAQFPGNFSLHLTSDDNSLEPGQRDPTSYGKRGDDFLNGALNGSSAAHAQSGLKCEFCPQHFPNTYLLKMHKFYSHSIPYLKQEETEMAMKRAEDSIPEGEKQSGKTSPTGEMPTDSENEEEVNPMMVPGMLVSAELNHPPEVGESSDQPEVPPPSSLSNQSQDLQKLHSMIKDLLPEVHSSSSSPNHDRANVSSQQQQQPEVKHDTSSMDGTTERCICHLCKYECDNRYFLRAHLINEHGFPPSEDAFHQTLTSQLDALAMKNLLEQKFQQFQQQSSGLQPDGSSNSGSEAFCDICNKEFCSKYFLRTHRKNIHGIEDPMPQNSPNSNAPQPTSGLKEATGERASPSPQSLLPPALLNSLYQRAKTPAELETLSLALNQAALQSKLSQREARESQATPPRMASSPSMANPTIAATIRAAMASMVAAQPTQGASMSQELSRSLKNPIGGATGRNYCNICNKELCNKYFMKTHMLKMHGINIDEHPIEAASTSTIGGVTCDICQKELCSKYFLKVHKQNTHGIYEDGSAPVLLGPSPGSRNSSNSNSNPTPNDMNQLLMMMGQASGVANSSNQQPEGDSNSNPGSSNEKDGGSKDGESRYYSGYQEVCQFCERRFKSIKWLKAHMVNDHADVLQMMRSSELAQAQLDPTGRLCFICGQTFSDRIQMQVHLFKEHKSGSQQQAQDEFTLKMALMAAAMASSSNHESNEIRMGSESDEAARQSPQSLPSPQYANSPKESAKTEEQMQPNPLALLMQSPAAIQSLLLKNQGGLNLALAAAAAASASGSPADQFLAKQWMSTLLGGGVTNSTPNFGGRNTNYPFGQQQQQQQVRQYVCQICNRSYRHSHSLQRHIHSSHKNPPTTTSSSSSTVTSQSAQAQMSNNSTTTPTHSLPASLPAFAEFGPMDLLPRAAATSSPATSSANGDPSPPEKPRNKRYRCSKCNKKFRTRELCLVHIRALHSTKPDDPRGGVGIEVRCTVCGQMVSNLRELRSHIEANHPTNLSTSRRPVTPETQGGLDLRTSEPTTSQSNHRPVSPGSDGEDEMMVQMEAKPNSSPHHSATSSNQPNTFDDDEEEANEEEEEANNKMDEGEEEDEEISEETPANSETSTNTQLQQQHPSLICVNGEQY